MKKRENIVEKFSTFLKFGDRKSIWQADLRLKRHIEQLIEFDPLAKQEFWARFFLKRIRELSPEGSTESGVSASAQSGDNFRTVNNLKPLDIPSAIVARHLSAYLQEACLWAAQKSYLKYKTIRYKYPVEEYFQIGSVFANLPAKLLKSFNLEYPDSNLEGYAKTAIFRAIRDRIYQQDWEAKREKFSDYGLLRVLTAKELKQALSERGIQASEIDSYRIAWQGFCEIYQPKQAFGGRNLAPPDREEIEQITEFYNRRLKQLDLIGEVAVDPDRIQEMLIACIKAVRSYRTRQSIPLEESDRISDFYPTPWDLAVQEEERQQVQLLVSQLFADLPEAGQIVLILWQGLKLTQSEIAIVVQTQYPELKKQYQIARFLARINKDILRNLFTKWNQIDRFSANNTEQNIERVKEALEPCLQLHCQFLLDSLIEQAIERMSEKDKSCLLAVKKDQLCQQLPIAELDPVSRNSEIAIQTFIANLEAELHLPSTSMSSVSQKVYAFLQEWLDRKKPFKSQ